jgi:hypothetical protein
MAGTFFMGFILANYGDRVYLLVRKYLALGKSSLYEFVRDFVQEHESPNSPRRLGRKVDEKLDDHC